MSSKVFGSYPKGDLAELRNPLLCVVCDQPLLTMRVFSQDGFLRPSNLPPPIKKRRKDGLPFAGVMGRHLFQQRFGRGYLVQSPAFLHRAGR